jgi:alpha-1,2-mannosyltransferase
VASAPPVHAPRDARLGDARRVSPLRIRWPRLRLWAIALFGIGLAPILAAPFYGFHDWPDFWSAGNVVGTRDLVDAARLEAWQIAHGLPPVPFPYPPAAALLLKPFALLPLDVSFWLHAAVMLLCAGFAGRVGARVYGLPVQVGVLSTLGWAPVTGAIVIAQNTPLALLLAILGIAALLRGADRGAGWLGALLYKPTLAAPLAGLLLIRGRWRALVVVALAVVAWYAVGIPAAGGDLGWPVTWFTTLRGWLANDTIQNADKAVSLTGLLARLAVPDWLPILGGAILVLLALPRLVRAPLREAAAGALLVGVAASPHAWSYEAALLMPFIWWLLAGGIAEPWRTRLVVWAYVAAPLWMISRQTQISVVAIIVLGAVALWLAGSWRADAEPARAA